MMRRKLALILFPIVVIGMGLGVFLFVDNAKALPPPLEVTPDVDKMDNLIGATGAKWTFTGQTNKDLASGDLMRFVFPIINNGTPFEISNPATVSSSGITLYTSLGGVPLSNILKDDPSLESDDCVDCWNFAHNSFGQGWSGVSNYMTSTAFHGNRGLYFPATSTNAYVIYTPGGSVHGIVSNTPYTASYYAKGLSTSTVDKVTMAIEAQDATCGKNIRNVYNFQNIGWDCVVGDDLLSSSSPYQGVFYLSDHFVRTSTTFLTPTTDTFEGVVNIYIIGGGTDSEEDNLFVVDAIQLEEGESATDFNLGGTTEDVEGVDKASFDGGPGQPPQSFIYGYVNTTTPTSTDFSFTFDGINNPGGSVSDLAANKLTWEVEGGTLSGNDPTETPFLAPKVSVTTTAGVIRAGGSLIVDENANISVSNSATGTTNVTYTFVTRVTSSIPMGGKIIVNFPSSYNSLLSGVSVSTTEYISGTSTIASLATTTVNSSKRMILTVTSSPVAADSALTVKIYGVTNPSTANVYGGNSGGPSEKFFLYTTKSNGGLLDGSFWGGEPGDFGPGTPEPPSSIHIGGNSNINVLVYKRTVAGDLEALTADERALVKVNMGNPDKGFFVGSKYLNSDSMASYNKILDGNYMVGVEPFSKGDNTFYDSFLNPAMKTVQVLNGATVTTTAIFGVPDTEVTLQLTGGVVGQNAFIEAYSTDYQSFTPVFTDTDYITEGFSSTGTGYAILEMRSGQTWNFSVQGGQFGGAENFSSGTTKYWSPVISAYYVASSGTVDIGAYPYVVADKTLNVNLKKAGTDEAETMACVGVRRSGGGFMMEFQDMVCGDQLSGTTTYSFQVPAGSISIGVMRPGFGRPEEYPVAITSAVTNKTISVSVPTTYISVTVQDAAGNAIRQAPIWANGPSFGQGVTGNTGTTTIYVMPGNYIVQGFAPGLGQLTSQDVVVPGSGEVPVIFSPNMGNLRTVTGSVKINNVGVAGVKIGARGLDVQGGNGTETDSSGNYVLYVPSGVYEIGGWSQETGGLTPFNSVDVTSGNVSGKNWSLGAQGILQITISNASTISPLFAGAFDPTSNRGNGTDTWTISGTSKIARITLPAGIYMVGAGSPLTGPIIDRQPVTITGGNTVDISGNASAISSLVKVSGTICTGGGGIEDCSGGTGIANVVVWAAKTGGEPGFYSTQTGNDGTYSLQVPENKSYRLGIKAMGYIADAGDVAISVVTTTVAQDLRITASGVKITGSIQNTSTVKISNGWVRAKTTIGGNEVWTGGPTDANGDYSLDVVSGTWTVYADGPGYYPSTGTTTVVATVDKVVNIILISLSGYTAPVPDMRALSDTSGGQVSRAGMTLDIPANALGSAGQNVTVSISSSSMVKKSGNATPLSNSVQSITAQNSSGESITNLNNNVSLVISYNEDDLPTGFDETKIQLGYFDESIGQWEAVASSVNTTTNEISASISHFTDYGPILQGVPSAPQNLTATAASASQINLTWDAVAGADYYIVYATTTAITSFPTSTLVATSTSASYSHTGLEASTTWYYKVAGYNENGEGQNSDRANATTDAGEVAGVTVSETGVTVAEDSGTDTYTVVLDTAPSSDVVITAVVSIASESSADFSLSPSTLTFTSGNWSTPQTITVTAVSDSSVEGTETATITHTASSSDNNYNGITIANVTVTITDNDFSGSSGLPADTTPPTNTSVVIAGEATSTASTTVTLTLAATGASHMMIANDSVFTGVVWETYTTSKIWTLIAGAGTKTVYAKFKDASNNVSTAVSDSIILTGATTTVTTTLPIVPITPVVTPVAPVITPISITPATLISIDFRTGLTLIQKQGIVNLINTGRLFSEIDAKNYAYAIGQSNWQQFVSENPNSVVEFTLKFRAGLTTAQKAGITNLVNSGRLFSETDAKNYAYATVQSNWSQFVGTNPKSTIAKVTIKFRTGLTVKQKQGITNLVNSGRLFSTIDAKNYAYAIGQNNWSQFVGTNPAK